MAIIFSLNNIYYLYSTVEKSYISKNRLIDHILAKITPTTSRYHLTLITKKTIQGQLFQLTYFQYCTIACHFLPHLSPRIYIRRHQYTSAATTMPSIYSPTIPRYYFLKFLALPFTCYTTLSKLCVTFLFGQSLPSYIFFLSSSFCDLHTSKSLFCLNKLTSKSFRCYQLRFPNVLGIRYPSNVL